MCGCRTGVLARPDRPGGLSYPGGGGGGVDGGGGGGGGGGGSGAFWSPTPRPPDVGVAPGPRRSIISVAACDSPRATCRASDPLSTRFAARGSFLNTRIDSPGCKDTVPRCSRCLTSTNPSSTET